MNYQEINAKTIDEWCLDGWEWGKPISHEIYEKALKGDWNVQSWIILKSNVKVSGW